MTITKILLTTLLSSTSPILTIPLHSPLGKALKIDSAFSGMSNRVVQRPPDELGCSERVHREEWDVRRTRAPHYAHFTPRSSVASDGEEMCKAARKAGGREGVYEGWVS